MAASSEPIRVAVTGAGGQIGYSLLPLIASGQMFGADQPVIIHCIEINIQVVLDKLAGTVAELQDCAYPLLAGVEICSNSVEDRPKAWGNIDYAVLVGGFPRKAGMLRAELLKKNASIFQEAGECLEQYAKETTKVLVVANPANTNCFVASHFAPKIPKNNFCALTRLDFNRANGLLAATKGVSVTSIKNIVIWGNHSKAQVPDCSHATIDGSPVEMDEYLTREDDQGFMHRIQYRGAEVIKMRGASSAVSAANAAKDNIRDWHLGTADGCTVAMSVWSEGNPYGVPDGLFYSFPCTVSGGEWSIATGFDPDEKIRTLMEKSAAELQTEQKTVLEAFN